MFSIGITVWTKSTSYKELQLVLLDLQSYCPIQAGGTWLGTEEESFPACFTLKYYLRGKKKKRKKENKPVDRHTNSTKQALWKSCLVILGLLDIFHRQKTSMKELQRTWVRLWPYKFIEQRVDSKNYFQNRPLNDGPTVKQIGLNRVRYKVMWLCQRRQGGRNPGYENQEEHSQTCNKAPPKAPVQRG